MAKFSFDGVDYISAKFEQLAQIDDEDKMSVIRPAAEFLKGKHQEKILTKFKKRTGALAGSITVEQKSDDDGAYAHISPKGKHPRSSTGKRMKKVGDSDKRRSAGKYSGTNAEVAYILEYGSPRIPASHWMEEANEEAADEVVAIQQEAWDQLITEKGL